VEAWTHAFCPVLLAARSCDVSWMSLVCIWTLGLCVECDVFCPHFFLSYAKHRVQSNIVRWFCEGRKQSHSHQLCRQQHRQYRQPYTHNKSFGSVQGVCHLLRIKRTDCHTHVDWFQMLPHFYFRRPWLLFPLGPVFIAIFLACCLYLVSAHASNHFRRQSGALFLKTTRKHDLCS